MVQIVENLKYGAVQNVFYFFISDNKGKGKR